MDRNDLPEYPGLMNDLEPYESPTEDSDQTSDDEFHGEADEIEEAIIGGLRQLGLSAPKVLPSPTIETIAAYIKTKKPKNIIIMSGAGISTAAGIPDFRSPKTGLYANLQKYKLPHPEAVFEIEFFKRNPLPFYQLSRELQPGNHFPTLTHYFAKLLNDKGMLRRMYTQNIDTLETIAGLPREKIVEAHGSYGSVSCAGGWIDPSIKTFIGLNGDLNTSYMSNDPRTRRKSCGEKMTMEYFTQEINAGRVPLCKKCGGLAKPDIVFFGEGLPPRFFEAIDQDFESEQTCDLALVLGTSLQVGPFNQLPEMVPRSVPRLLINMTPAGTFGHSIKTAPFRDAFWQGGCDEGCLELARALGFENELREMHAKGHADLKKLWEAKKAADEVEVQATDLKSVNVFKPESRQVVITSGGIVLEEELRSDETAEDQARIAEVVDSLLKSGSTK